MLGVAHLLWVSALLDEWSLEDSNRHISMVRGLDLIDAKGKQRARWIVVSQPRLDVAVAKAYRMVGVADDALAVDEERVRNAGDTV